MNTRYRDHSPELVYKHMDARQLQYNDASFDVVIDKATFDTILCDDGQFATQML